MNENDEQREFTATDPPDLSGMQAPSQEKFGYFMTVNMKKGGQQDTASQAKNKISEFKEQYSYKILDKKYQMGKEIGRGGMGVIHQLYDKELHRDLAMKTLTTHDNPLDVDSFLEESQISAQLEHPNIVPIHDIGINNNDHLFFTMKLVMGEELRAILIRLRKNSPEDREKYNEYELLDIFLKVCDAVAFAHSRGVIHRDIKPENIMIGDYGQVFLMDWGLAKYIGGSQEEQSGAKQFSAVYSHRKFEDFCKTAAGTIQGTPLYMSPEQTFGQPELVDKLSDIYLLGGTLYHMMTLYPPHRAINFQNLISNIRGGKTVPPTEIDASIPLELSRIILKALAVKKEDRYQSVEELIQDIDAYRDVDIKSDRRIFKTGEFLMRQGEEGKEGYYLHKGKVEIFANIGGKSALLTTVTQNNTVGEMALISAEKRSADVVAAEETVVTVIGQEQMQAGLTKMPPWMEQIVKKLVKRLNETNSKVHPLLIEDADYHILNQLAAQCSLQVYKQQAQGIEEIEISLSLMTREIAAMLCISDDRVKTILDNLLKTELAQIITDDTFKLCNFPLFSHVLDFLHGVFEINSPGIPGTYPIDDNTKRLRCKLAAQISQKAKELLSNIPIFAGLLE